MAADGEARLDAGQLFRFHAAFVTRFLGRLGVEVRDLDDTVQEVFLVAHRRGGFVERSARARTWLAEIAVNVVGTARRTESRRRRRLSDAASLADIQQAPTLDGQVEAIEALRRVDAALSTLSLDQRVVFILFEIEGERCEDIAAARGLPVGTVYSRLRAAREAFIQAYARLEQPGGQGEA